MSDYNQQRIADDTLRIANALERIAKEMERVEVTDAPNTVQTDLGEFNVPKPDPGAVLVEDVHEDGDRFVKVTGTRALEILKMTEGIKPQQIRSALHIVDDLDAALDAYHLALLNREHGGVAGHNLVRAVEAAFGRGGFVAQRERLLGSQS